jgi:hypothetical protein
MKLAFMSDKISKMKPGRTPRVAKSAIQIISLAGLYLFHLLALRAEASPYHARFMKQKKTVVVVLTSGTSWVVPADWNSANNTIECIGGGGGGSGGKSTRAGGAGGGAAYAKSVNVTLLSSPANYQIGAAGNSGAYGSSGTAGGDSYFCNSNVALNCTSIAGGDVSVGAKGGSPGTNNGPGGAGGSSITSIASGTGSLKYTGGAGGGGASPCRLAEVVEAVLQVPTELEAPVEVTALRSQQELAAEQMVEAAQEVLPQLVPSPETAAITRVALGAEPAAQEPQAQREPTAAAAAAATVPTRAASAEAAQI